MNDTLKMEGHSTEIVPMTWGKEESNIYFNLIGLYVKNMSEMESRCEISKIYNNYFVTVNRKETTGDKELQYIIENLYSNHIPFEKPDAYVVHNNVGYAIEHFQISQYQRTHKKGDLGKIAASAKQNREKLHDDRRLNLNPSIQNLSESLKNTLSEHMRSEEVYKSNVKAENQGISDCKLIFVIEDASDQAAYVEKFDLSPRNPLLFDGIADAILSYEGKLWAVIYIGGNEKEKSIEGYTVAELKAMKENGKLLDMQKFRTMHAEDERIISKDDEAKDEHTVTIKINDRMFFRE